MVANPTEGASLLTLGQRYCGDGVSDTLSDRLKARTKHEAEKFNLTYPTVYNRFVRPEAFSPSTPFLHPVLHSFLHTFLHTTPSTGLSAPRPSCRNLCGVR